MLLQKNSLVKALALFFTIFGAIFMLVGGLLFGIFHIVQSSLGTVTGTAIAVDAIQTSTTVSYSIDGVDYISEVSAYSSSIQAGDEMTVQYNRDNPQKLYPSMGLFKIIFVSIFGGIGGISLVIAVVPWIAARKQKSHIQSAENLNSFAKSMETPDIG